MNFQKITPQLEHTHSTPLLLRFGEAIWAARLLANGDIWFSLVTWRSKIAGDWI